MKRAISILLIITVNALFLTHAILPHHHHDGIPHFTFIENDHHHAEDDGCCCPVSNNTCDDTCAFETEIDVIVAQEDEHGHCIICGASHDDIRLLVQAVLLPALYESLLPEEKIPDKQPPYLISYQTEYVSQSLGLRAPPVA